MLRKRINAKKGDVILTSNYPLTYQVVSVFGGYWGHCGMIMDDKGTTIRHCNFHMDQVKMEWNIIFGVKIFPKRFIPSSLSNGMPGFITQTIDEAFFGKNPDFFIENGFVLKPLPENEEKYRPLLHEVADKMADLDGYYRLNSYMHLDQQDNSNQRRLGRGTACTAAIYFAHKFCGKEMNLAEISAEMVKKASKNLYNYLWTIALEKYGVVGSSILKVTDVGRRMGNQVVNTYLADRSSDMTDWWKHNIRSTINIAPDHLLPREVKNPDGNDVGVQDENSSYYGEIIPIIISEIS
ncbi:MAG: hypothetical protein ACFFBP_00805 [Promethearchaeota archaeon]